MSKVPFPGWAITFPLTGSAIAMEASGLLCMTPLVGRFCSVLGAVPMVVRGPMLTEKIGTHGPFASSAIE